MDRIYTDERFPAFKIENHGTFRFFVVENGKELATFIARESLTSPQVSEEFARRRAEDYFDRMARMDLSGELSAQEPGQVAPIRDVNPQEVERALAAARAEMDPEKKRRLEQHALRLMRREESLAEQTVGYLLYDS